MSAAELSLQEKIAELAETLAGQDVQAETASNVVEKLRGAYPEFDKFMARRFARLPVAHQRFMVILLQEAGAIFALPWLTAWSRTSSLSLAVRALAVTALAHLGTPTDTPYGEALQRAATILSQLQDTPESLSETGDLSPRWQQAVIDLPFALAVDLAQELIDRFPALALAVLRALRPIADTRECHTLVTAMAQIPSEDAAVTLQEILANTADKALQKTIKKALHRLRAQGVAIDETQQHAHTAVVGSVTHRLERCLASHIDGAGDRALWMIRTRPFGGYNIAYLVVNYGSGIQAALGLQASKRELPELLDKAQEHFRLIELDPAYCQYQVALAHQMNLDSRTPVPEEFFAVRDIIGDTSTTFDRAMIYSVLSDDDLREARAYTDRAEDLLELPEFSGWTLPAAVIQKYGDQLQDIDESQIVISSAMRQERVKEVYARATTEVLGETSRRIMRLRLEEMAYYLLQTDRRREALWAVAAAQSMQPADPSRLQRHAFIEALLERSLQRAKEHAGRRIVLPFSHLPESHESRLII